MRLLLAGTLALSLGFAPLQCRREADPELRREDTAGDALYSLAQDFRAKGDEAAAQKTLRFLVTRYPSSRHVVAAREELSHPPAPKTEGDAGK